MYPNERVLRDALQAIQQGDEGLRNKVIAEGVVAHVAGRSKLSGDWVGRGAVGRRVHELTGGRMELEVIDVLASADDHACGIYRMRVTCPDAVLEWDHVNIYRIVDGQIVEVWQKPLTQEDQERVDEFFS